MNGIRVTRLSGIEPGIEYKRKEGLGSIPHYRNTGSMGSLGNEFAGLGCTCNSLSGNCDEGEKASQLLKEFEQRVKNHLINTYNYIVKNRAQCGIANPDQVALVEKTLKLTPWFRCKLTPAFRSKLTPDFSLQIDPLFWGSWKITG